MIVRSCDGVSVEWKSRAQEETIMIVRGCLSSFAQPNSRILTVTSNSRVVLMETAATRVDCHLLVFVEATPKVLEKMRVIDGRYLSPFVLPNSRILTELEMSGGGPQPFCVVSLE